MEPMHEEPMIEFSKQDAFWLRIVIIALALAPLLIVGALAPFVLFTNS